ncbi:MAG: hypothetical protein K2Y10_04015 [Burkholderiaceae bacterium]|nr:hypothetical protein [Burkholderiaceae bacterium]
MQDAHHAARLVALQSALLSLLAEQAEAHKHVDGITLTLSTLEHGIYSIDLTYTHHGLPVAGEGF